MLYSTVIEAETEPATGAIPREATDNTASGSDEDR